METNNLNQADDLHRMGKNKTGILALFGVLALIFGLVLYSTGVFSVSDNKNETANNLEKLQPPEAKNKEFAKQKYSFVDSDEPKKNFSEGVGNLKSLTGADPIEKSNSNEFLNETDFKTIGSSNGPQKSSENRAIKTNLNRQLVAEEAKQKYISKPNTAIFQKTKAEIWEEKKEMQQEDINRRTTALMLNNLEKIQNTNYSDQMPPKNNQEIQKINENTLKSENGSKVSIQPNIEFNNTGNHFSKSDFFTLKINSKKSFSAFEGIPAAIHGQGESISISDGGIITVRILEPLTLNTDTEKIILKAGTFINFEASFQKDRLFFTTNTISTGNIIYPISISVFDLDGQKGIYVSNLLQKSQAIQEIGQSGLQSFSNSGFISAGSISRQIGSQIAISTGQQLIQAGKALMQRRIAKQTATIKANYKIILKSENLTKNENI